MYPLFNYPLVWLLGCVIIAFICHFLQNKLFIDLSYFTNVACFLSLVISCYLIMQLIVGIKANQNNILKYFSSLTIADMVRKALLNTMNLNRLKDSNFIEVPNIYANFDGNNNINLVVGKLAGMYDLDKMTEDINSSLRGIYSRYAVVSAGVFVDGTNFNFLLEDVDKSYRFVVKNNDVTPFISDNPHKIKLAKNLTWDSVATPMLSVVGRTRSGKSVFAQYLLEIMSKQGWKIRYYSAKGDIYTKKFKGESDPKKIIESLEDWLEVMKQRNQQIADAGASKYTEIGLDDVALVIDEIGLLNGLLGGTRAKLYTRWKNVITSLMGAGASSGIHVVAMSQRGTQDFFLPSSALVNARDAVIMLGLAADSATDRQYLMSGYELEHRAYSAGQGLALFVTSGKRWEQPNFYETPFFLDYEKKEKAND